MARNLWPSRSWKSPANSFIYLTFPINVNININIAR